MGLLLLLLAAAHAQELRGRLVPEKEGAALSGYVVWVEDGEKLPPLAAEPARRVMRQEGKQFAPRFLALRAGDSVLYENRDKVFHNVFSLDKRNRFDLGLYKGDKRFGADFKPLEGAAEPAVSYAEPGRYEVFCNIHPDMSGAVRVFGHGYFAETGPDGSFALPHPGPGKRTLKAEGPRLEEPAVLELELSGEDPVLEWKLAPKRRARTPAHTNKEGEPYEKPGPY